MVEKRRDYKKRIDEEWKKNEKNKNKLIKKIKEYELFDERMTSTGMVNTLTGIRSNGRSEAFDAIQRRQELLRNIASDLATKIDTKFIDNNQDLKKEIYYILKYNDEYNTIAGQTQNIRVSYIPPEDIHHIYFELDEDTGRGISDLQLSLIPAKLWVAIYITNCLGIMTRGNDKRVYYVRQSVETNISKTLLKTINEIKKANFGIRQIENINSVLNITGRFNDYIIPRSADGQSPIEFEVMQGQQIEIKTELLNLLEESAINVTGVPIEIIQNRQSPDYAMQLTMSNSKFLRFVYDRQSEFQNVINRLITNIYDIEYSTRDRISLTLPPPLFINVTNTNQLITNTAEYCDNITNIVMADEQDDILKQKVAKELKIYHLGSYINMGVINDIINKAKQSSTKDAITGDADGEGGIGAGGRRIFCRLRLLLQPGERGGPVCRPLEPQRLRIHRHDARPRIQLLSAERDHRRNLARRGNGAGEHADLPVPPDEGGGRVGRG